MSISFFHFSFVDFFLPRVRYKLLVDNELKKRGLRERVVHSLFGEKLGDVAHVFAQEIACERVLLD
jgi:hypothetical protein